MRHISRTGRIVIAAAITGAVAMLPAMALAAPGASAVRQARSLPATAPCRSADVVVWLGLGPTQGPSQTAYPLEITNTGAVSRDACSLEGYPGAIAINSAARRVGLPAGHLTAAHHVITLRVGQTANATIIIRSPGFVSGCHRASAAGLEVSLPGGTATQAIYNFSFAVCANKVSLDVLPFHAGVGIP